MTDREKLIEVLTEACHFSIIKCHKRAACGMCDNNKYGADCHEGDKADYLLSHGVTFEKQGEWIDNGERDIRGVPKPFAISCSICGSSAGTSWMNHCPNCGARMKGEKT